MTRDEAVDALATRYRLRLGLGVRHGDRLSAVTGSTMGATPAELRAAAHALVDTMLAQLVARVDRPDPDA